MSRAFAAACRTGPVQTGAPRRVVAEPVLGRHFEPAMPGPERLDDEVATARVNLAATIPCRRFLDFASCRRSGTCGPICTGRPARGGTQ